MKKLVALLVAGSAIFTLASANVIIDQYVDVTANPLWTNTFVDLQVGDVLTITNDVNDTWLTWDNVPITAAGSDYFTYGKGGGYDRFLQTPDALHSCMIGYIGSNEPTTISSDYFAVNLGTTLTVADASRLWLGCNDDATSHAINDNGGSILAHVVVERNQSVPEPGIIALLGFGLVGLFGLRRKIS